VRIWITGAAGFVGRRLVAALTSAGHTVIGVDREIEITDAPCVARSLMTARRRDRAPRRDELARPRAARPKPPRA
jgi:nucleoside-diphosphate-sugar epimerase